MKYPKTTNVCINRHRNIKRNMEGKCIQCVAESRNKMISIDHLLGLKRDEKELIDPYFYEEFI